MKRLWTGITMMALTLGVCGQGMEKKPETKPIAVFEWLVGGVWTTESPGPGLKGIETRYEWADNKAYLRFTTHFVFDTGTARMYDGSLFWDATKNGFVMWYMDARGQIIEGPVTVEGDTWTLIFRGANLEGKIADLRAEITRKSKDDYHWAVFERQGDRWKPLLAADYHRGNGA